MARRRAAAATSPGGTEAQLRTAGSDTAEPVFHCAVCDQDRPERLRKEVGGAFGEMLEASGAERVMCRICFASALAAPYLHQLRQLHAKRRRFPCPTPAVDEQIRRVQGRVIKVFAGYLSAQDGAPLITQLFAAAAAPPAPTPKEI